MPAPGRLAEGCWNLIPGGSAARPQGGGRGDASPDRARPASRTWSPRRSEEHGPVGSPRRDACRPLLLAPSRTVRPDPTEQRPRPGGADGRLPEVDCREAQWLEGPMLGTWSERERGRGGIRIRGAESPGSIPVTMLATHTPYFSSGTWESPIPPRRTPTPVLIPVLFPVPIPVPIPTALVSTSRGNLIARHRQSSALCPPFLVHRPWRVAAQGRAQPSRRGDSSTGIVKRLPRACLRSTARPGKSPDVQSGCANAEAGIGVLRHSSCPEKGIPWVVRLSDLGMLGRAVKPTNPGSLFPGPFSGPVGAGSPAGSSQESRPSGRGNSSRGIFSRRPADLGRMTRRVDWQPPGERDDDHACSSKSIYPAWGAEIGALVPDVHPCSEKDRHVLFEKYGSEQSDAGPWGSRLSKAGSSL
ncbi:hypothetical protein JHW43_007543 [Diplocarpon mali]|nr:hypothetical protein JHW43_007543 [Diplocarpon mali]